MKIHVGYSFARLVNECVSLLSLSVGKLLKNLKQIYKFVCTFSERKLNKLKSC